MCIDITKMMKYLPCFNLSTFRGPTTVKFRPSRRTNGRSRARLAALLTALFVLIIPAQTAGAWTDTTEKAILARSLGTMPRSLRLVLTRHRGELYREAASCAVETGLSRPELIDAECRKTVRMIRERRPFALTAGQLGRVGALVAATADPYLAAAGGRPAPAHRGFERFTERMLHLIPFVVTSDRGFSRQDLLEGRVEPAAYLAHGLDVSSAYLDDLETHVPAAVHSIKPWASFDSRSTPFGVASIAVSRGASRVSAVWQWIWLQAGGAEAPGTSP